IKNFSLVYSEDVKSVRLAPAYDIISTMIYENSTEDMAMSIGGVYDINKIDRSAFERQARIVGLGVNLAMKSYDAIVSRFTDALNKARVELDDQGYDGVDEIYNKILSNGGIKNYK
ncbi:MAG: HipA domain-containing protein, partial [bacterium]|nr:HipA domain-containing protein [bacterium]